MTDTERLDWLGSKPDIVLVSTYDGRWGITGDVVDPPQHEDTMLGSFAVDLEDLKPTIREAIDEAMRLDQEDDHDDTDG